MAAGRAPHWAQEFSRVAGWAMRPHWAKNLPVAGNALRPPISLFGAPKRETGCGRSKEKKRFGGSVRASADLLPPAGEGWHSRAVIRDGNALPLGLSKPGEVPDTFRSAFTRKGYAASPRKGDATSVARRSRERLSSVRRQSRKRLRSRCR